MSNVQRKINASLRFDCKTIKLHIFASKDLQKNMK